MLSATDVIEAWDDLEAWLSLYARYFKHLGGGKIQVSALDHFRFDLGEFVEVKFPGQGVLEKLRDQGTAVEGGLTDMDMGVFERVHEAIRISLPSHRLSKGTAQAQMVRQMMEVLEVVRVLNHSR